MLHPSSKTSTIASLIGIAFFFAASPLFAADSSAQRKEFLRSELAEKSAPLDAATQKQKYVDMGKDALTFYRATAYIYYKDIERGGLPIPAAWAATPAITTWINGDFHTQNVGFFHSRENKIVFSENDFDESFVGPFYFDLIRFIGALYLHTGLTAGWNLSANEADETALDGFLSEYQATLESVNGNDNERDFVLDETSLPGALAKKAAELLQSRSIEKQLSKWTTFDKDGRRIFNLKKSDLVALSAEDAKELDSGWDSYLASLGDFAKSRPANYFAIKDRAVRVNSGLGSRGIKKFYLLIEGPTADKSDDLLLEVKESVLPAMMSSALRDMAGKYEGAFGKQHGKRSLLAVRASLSKYDEHFGFMSGALRSYLVRPISPWKQSYDPETFASRAEFTDFVRAAARALAYAHARADRDFDPAYVGHQAEAGILNAIKRWPTAKKQLRDLGKSYAEQVRADFELFRQLIAEGKL